MTVEIPANPERLDNILAGIHQHGGKVTLGQDWAWLQRVQHEMPAWAKAVFDKYKDIPYVYADELKRATR
jgi:hypothetical protein